MPEPERRRRRPAVSCSLCRKRKVRCNREVPCSNCVASKNQDCVYEAHQPLPPRKSFGYGRNQNTEVDLIQGYNEIRYSVPGNQTSTTGESSTIPKNPSSSAVSSADPLTPISLPSAGDIEFMRGRIRQLEEQLSNETRKTVQPTILTPNSNIETTISPNTAAIYSKHESHLFGEGQIISHSIVHKTRLFGQSHWSNIITLLGDTVRMLEPLIHEETSNISCDIKRAKSLGKIIKLRLAPQWPPAAKANLPSKEIADKLVDCYIRTTESIYRILHIPSFRRDYEALWLSNTEPDPAFLVQVKLVLAIGATTYDERFSLRTSAVQWVYDAQAWISEPKFKSRLSIQALQNNILLLLARETANVGGDLIWIETGALVRTAVYMGLHRDPTYLPKKTIFAAEMRRRLWNTVLEIALRSSTDSGGPPLISLSDFDTVPPSNFDDDQLLAEDPVPKADTEFTQVSIIIALRKAFAARLAITKFLNDLSSHGSYEEVIRLDAELRAAHRALRRIVQGSPSSTGLKPSQFEIQALDYIISRYLVVLHLPFFGRALHEAAYAFSRKVVIENSLKLWCAAYPNSSVMTFQTRRDIQSSEQDDFTRLTICSSGFFRTVAFHAGLVLAVELKAQLQEDESISPTLLRPDLLSVLEETKTWCLQCIEAGEVNIKGYVLISVFAAHVQCLIRGIDADEIPQLLFKTAEEAKDKCLPILEEMVAQGQAEVSEDASNQMTLNQSDRLVEDWDFMMSEAQFNLSNAEPMSWLFNYETMQEQPLW